jgi:hypothetical protein
MSVMFFGLFALLAVPFTVFYLWALVDALRTPQRVWEAAEQNQLLWVGVMVFLTLLGAILYTLVARPRLQAVVASGEATMPATG